MPLEGKVRRVRPTHQALRERIPERDGSHEKGGTVTVGVI